MQILSVNVGVSQSMMIGSRVKKTGIYKLPTKDAVYIGENGLEGDVIHSKKHHGGPDQAVYIYTSVDYDWWEIMLGKQLSPGTFGENLTISDLESALCRIGDRLQIGNVLLEITAPRIPCDTFAQRMGDPMWVKQFRAAKRPGLYCRVITQGEVRTGDNITLEPYNKATVTVLEMFDMYYNKKSDQATLKRFLEAPIAIRARYDFEKRLELQTSTSI